MSVIQISKIVSPDDFDIDIEHIIPHPQHDPRGQHDTKDESIFELEIIIEDL